jgi:NCAIR mutase (PurE)-related protein
MNNRDLRIDSAGLQPAMTSPSPALLELMSRVIDGKASSDELLSAITAIRSQQAAADSAGTIPTGASADLGPDPQRTSIIPGATVDLGRQARCGFGEVIYGEGKSAELVTRIIRAQLDVGQSALVTRIDSGVAFQVRQSFEFSYHNPVAHTLRVTPTASSPLQPITVDQAQDRLHAAVVTAGSTDIPVAEEAMETLHWMGVSLQRFDDIGVAGPYRLLSTLPALRMASAVVVVAGMEGALPAVVAGHLAVPVFAVPTSVGYGANFGGLTALMSMLSTCAASVAVVNIDSGFKGGYLAGMVVRQLERLQQRLCPAGSTGQDDQDDDVQAAQGQAAEGRESDAVTG